ncbi:type II toxin-antitoxin system RelE/ParE family toxin [Nocardioides sp.]|uniref:type II toxin-antitoxin system RelE family toxin n=1 Tax=Nocardioides sp. TaxID=35761 RepID=UPI002ED817E0
MAGSERRYRIEVTPAAARQLRKLEPQIARRVQGAIEMLAVDPRPPASRPLRGRPGHRVRVGDYRLLYTVQDDVLIVVVIRLGHRRDVYDR